MKYNYAIDLGGAYTTIYVRDSGFVLKEPTMVAVEEIRGSYKIKAIGKDAQKLVWKTPESVEVFNPISNGVIENYEYAQVMIKYFLDKLDFKKNRHNVIVLVHCGITNEEKSLYRRLFEDVGFLEVDLVPSILCSAYGAGRNISSAKANITVNIGAGCTDVAAINLSSLIQGVSLGIGGKAMDMQIANYLALSKPGIFVGTPTAEKIKNEVGSLYNGDKLNMEVLGTNIETKTPAAKIVSASEIKPILEAFFEEIVRTIEVSISTLPPEMTTDVLNHGILFTGGVAQMVGLDEFLKKNLSYPFIIAENPEDTTILGAGKLLGDSELLDVVLKNN